MQLKLTRKLLTDCINIWNKREDGWHSWRKYYNAYITIEPCNDGDGDYLLIILTDTIDMLGYPYGKIINFFCIDNDDFENDKNLDNFLNMVIEK